MLIRIGSRKLYFELLGPASAPVIYLAHPLAADSGVWAEQVPPLLNAGFRVLRADMRGHGGSDIGSASDRMEELSDDAVHILDRLEIEKAHFCGVSIGGMISEGVALNHPERVLSLVLCNTRAAAPIDADTRWGLRVEKIRAQGTMEPIADSTMERWLTPEAKAARPQLWKQIRQTIASTPIQGYIGCSAAIRTFNWTGRLREISQPTLVACGVADTGSDINENREIAELVQNGRFVAIEGARHLPNAEDPALFNRLLIDWCRSNG